MKKHIASTWIVSILALTACGGSDNNGPSAPTISAQPVSLSVLTGATATFSVTAAGDGLSYQWKLNGTAIQGATAASYTTPPATWQSNGASYTVVVTNTAGSVTSSAAALNLKLSPDQQVFESFALAPNVSNNIDFNMPYSGAPVTGTDYLQTSAYSYSKSPLTNGPQVVGSTWTNLAKTLSLPNPEVPVRYLVNGAILVANTPNTVRISYEGSNIRQDVLAVDGTTVLASYMRTGFKVAPLSGASTPDELAQAFDPFSYNNQLISGFVGWQPGSAYMVFTEAAIGDIYRAIDYSTTQTTTDANIIPARTGTTLTAAVTAGIHNGVDNVTYDLTNGSITSVNGFPIYVANSPRPNRTTQIYLTFFGLNGNVYAANLFKAGTVIGGQPYQVPAAGGGFTLNYSQKYQVRLNGPATSTLQAIFAY